MSRKTARKHIFNLVFQTEFLKEETPVENFNTYIVEYGNVEKADREFILTEYKGIVEHIEQIDKEIDEACKWGISNLSKMSLAILRIGVYEIRFAQDIPNGVAVNEAVELAKQFGEDKAAGFVNGVLAGIAKKES